MLTRTRMLLAALAVGAAVALSPIMTDSASAQQQHQRGLVNVAVGDVTVLQNVAIGLAAQAAANICGVTVGNIAILAALAGQNQQPVTVCTIQQGDQTVPVTMQPAQGGGGGQGPNQNQGGLLNVAVGDVTVLQNVGIGAAAQIAANLCGVTVGNVAALAALVGQNQQTQTVCEIGQGDQAVPVTIQRGTGGGGGGGGNPGPDQRQLGLVNVAVGDVTIAENMALGAALQVAANACGVTTGNVALLAAAVLQNQETATVCTVEQDDQTVPVTIRPA